MINKDEELKNFKTFLSVEMKEMFLEKPEIKDFSSFKFQVKENEEKIPYMIGDILHSNAGVENDIRNKNYNHKDYSSPNLDKETMEYLSSNVKLEDIIKLAFPE